LHEVGNEIRAALIDRLDLGPLGVNGLGFVDQAVVAAAGDEDEKEDDDADGGEDGCFFHFGLRSIGAEEVRTANPTNPSFP
jgi:hypothetical protein